MLKSMKQSKQQYRYLTKRTAWHATELLCCYFTPAPKQLAHIGRLVQIEQIEGRRIPNHITPLLNSDSNMI